MNAETTEWYWDLKQRKAVPASERGASDDVLGPYPSRFEAENWKAKVEERNEEWAGADDAWDQNPDDEQH